MNKSSALMATAALALTIGLTGCAGNDGQVSGKVSAPGDEITRQSQPMTPDPPCGYRLCPR